ncbi:MAG: RNA methyltransferase [Acidobacteria bacterium]|nr:RNA methyltransferase [Acidobacteriota bacterium]
MIEAIARFDDPRVADYAHVGDAAWLRAHGLFVAEGRLVVRRLLAGGRFEVASVLVTPAARSALADVLEGAGAQVYVCGQEDLNALAGFNFHRGCIALAHRRQGADLDALLGARLLVAVEQVGNPDNVGGIFRSAHAFGAGGVVLDTRSADPLYRKAIRTSMGATIGLPFSQVEQWPAALGRLRDAGFEVLAFTPSGDADDLELVTSRDAGKVVLLFGSEDGGLSAAAFEAAHRRVRIPVDPRSDSLNVSVAAGIALHRFRVL